MIQNFKVNNLFEETFKISKELVDNFVKLSNDRNPLHTIDLYAIEKGFNSRVVQGNLQNCFISYFIGECLPSKNVMILSQTINYKNPVYINDILVFNAKIIGIFESVGLIEFDYEFNNQLNKVVSKGVIKIKIT
jgi:3-hydroxybutyryl-CoA dehydratase